MKVYGSDFQVGEVFHLGSHVVSTEEIVSFASRYDPQPYHLSEEAGKASFFGELAASGWNTAAIWMGLYVRGLLEGARVMGSPGVDDLRWFSPVLVGDELKGTVEVLDVIDHPFKRDIVTVKNKGCLYRSGEEKPLMTLILHSRYARRPSV